MDAILITGVCSAQGKLLAERLMTKYPLIGVDVRPWKGKVSSKFKFIKGDLRKKIFGTVLRSHKIKAVIHLAIHNSHGGMRPDQKHALNIMTLQKVIDESLAHKVKKFILLSEHSVYGALPGNPLGLKEEAPLNGARVFKEQASIVEIDHMCAKLFWMAPEMETVILRPVNIIGAQTRGALNLYLKKRVVPSVFGFDPMMQVIHEEDVNNAIILSLEKGFKGIYNVTGPGSLPLSILTREKRVKRIPMLEPIAAGTIAGLYRIKRFPLPPSGISLIQHVINVDGTRFEKASRFKPEIRLERML